MNWITTRGALRGKLGDRWACRAAPRSTSSGTPKAAYLPIARLSALASTQEQPATREIATPQSIMRDTVAGVLQSDRSNQYDVIYRAVYAAISALGPDLFSPEVVVDLDGRNLGRGSAKYVKQELIRSGEW